MTLPSFVIVHGKQDLGVGVDEEGKEYQRHVFLGPHSWTQHRDQALSFSTIGEGQAWLREAEKSTPKMIRGTLAKVISVEHKPKLQSAPGTIAHDYDPYGGDFNG